MVTVLQSLKGIFGAVINLDLEFSLKSVRNLAAFFDSGNFDIVQYYRLHFFRIECYAFVENVKVSMCIRKFPLSTVSAFHVPYKYEIRRQIE